MQYRKLELMSSNPEEEVTTMSNESENRDHEGAVKVDRADRADRADKKQASSFKLTKFLL
jgi:hypothetical protein